MKNIGITTTIPSEVIYAGGCVPVDLNNIFMNHPDKLKLVRQAEIEGIPGNFCAWVKGIFSVVKEEDIDEIVIVVQGDCSSTIALMEIFKLHGIKVIPFSYPYENDYSQLKSSINRLIKYFNTVWEEVSEVKVSLDRIRKKVHTIDRLTWKNGLVYGYENHYFTVSTSDMQGSPDRFEKKIDNFIAEIGGRDTIAGAVRLGYIGVPPIIDNLYDFIEGIGGQVVFNEVQRQFTMPFDTGDIVEQYRLYTYPYSLHRRIEDINREIALRKIDGLIHYVQSFCHHQAEYIIFSSKIDIPVLLLERDSPGDIDSRNKMRLESFVSMLMEKKEL